MLFNPSDISILKEGPAVRRRFLDIMISQLKLKYVYYMNEYLKTLEQRNTYLRQIKYENKPEELLDIWDEKLSDLGEKIYQYRYEFMEKIKNKINEYHSFITGGKENIDIKYSSSCKNKKEYNDILRKNRSTDILKGYTNFRNSQR